MAYYGVAVPADVTKPKLVGFVVDGKDGDRGSKVTDVFPSKVPIEELYSAVKVK